MKKQNTPAKFFGSKGGSVTRTADNLYSTDVVEALFGVSEGPIKGLKDGAKSFRVGDTPLEDVAGNSNFQEFELIVRQGGELGDDIYSRMGGFGSSTAVSQALTYNVPVTRSGNQRNIDYLDIRLVVNRLVKENDKGSFEHTGKVKIEYKRSDTGTWTLVRNPQVTPPPASAPVPGGTAWYSKLLQKVLPSNKDWRATAGLTAPSDTFAVWFDPNNNHQPKSHNGSSWVNIAGATLTGSTWTWTGRKATFGSAPPASKVAGDAWINNLTRGVSVWNGDIWASAGSTYTPGGVGENGTGGKITVAEGEIAIFGKTTTAFVKELRIPVPSHPTLTYDIRVTRTSPANTTELFFDVTWESFQEITAEKFNFPGLATTQVVARATDQFTQIPEMSGIYHGRIVKVPSNYNPVTRVYTGLWDGLWKLEYTNNPAFIGYDLVSNARYGLNAYYPVTLNKFDVYEAGKWCDQITADGTPRFTFNGVIDQPRNAREAINYIFGIFGGRFFDDGNGFGVIRLDNDSPAVAIFSPENVEKGVFSYSQTPLSTRHNDVTVTFINPDQNWQEDRRRVSDANNIATFGRNADNIVAVGCTNEKEAIRRGRYKLITGLTEKTMVGFTTNRAGSFLQPYDVILVADEDHQFGLHGRIASTTGNNQINLREPLYLEAGISYRLSFTDINVVDGEYTVATVDVAGGQSGSRTSLTVVGTLPAAAVADRVFTLHQVGTTIAPKPFRVMDIEVDEDDNDQVKITAVEVNRAKWAFIDGIVDEIVYNGFYDLETSQIPLPVPSATVHSTTVTRGKRVIRTLHFAWEPSPSTFVTRYRLSYSVNGGPMVELATVASLRHEWPDVTPANYTFQIEPVGHNGLLGRPALFEHRMLPDDDSLLPISNLLLSSAGIIGSDGTYVPVLIATWDPVLDAPISEYQVEFKESTASLWNSTARASASFELVNPKVGVTYNVRVRALSDAVVVRSWASASLLVVGDVTAPPVPTGWVAKSNFDGITLSGDESPASDFRAFIIYGSAAADPTLVRLAQVSGNTYSRYPVPGDPITRYKISAVDFSGNESDKTAYITATPIIYSNPNGPATPTGLQLTTNLRADGQAVVVATWTAGGTDVVQYGVSFRVDGGSDVSFMTTSNRYEWVVQPNTLVWVKVRAFNALSIFSGWTAESSITASLDTVPPAIPTGLALTAGFGTIWLKWNRNTEVDLARYDIYEHTASSPAPTAGTTATFTTTADQLARSGLPDNVSRWYWVRAVDTSGNKSAWTSSVTGTTTAPAGVTTEALAGLIDATSFASNVKPVEIVSALPSTEHVQGRMVLLTTDNKIYRNTGSGWTAAVPTVDLTGQLASNQIADAAISAAKFASTVKPVEILSSLPSTGHVQGRMVMLTTDNKLYRNTGSGWTAAVPSTDITGTLADAQIAAVAAGKVTGQLTNTQIADLAATKISGQLTSAQIADLASTKITGTLTNSQIADVAAAKVTGQLTDSQIAAVATTKLTGTIANSQIAALDAAKLTGTVDAARIAALEAAKITGTLTNAQIAALDAAKLTGTVSTAQIADGSISGTKFASGLQPVEVLAALPGPTHVQGRMVLLTTDNKLYRNTGSGWTAAVPSTDITGTLADAQIAAVAATKVTGTLTSAQIASLDAAKLTSQIVSTQISDNAITTAKINAGAITAAKIATDTITANEIAANAITSSELAAGAVVAGKIAAGTIVANDIAAGAITTTKLAALAVTANEIAANAITTGKINAGAVTATELAAGAVTAGKIAAGTIVANDIAAGAITTAKIFAGAVTADQIGANAITTAKLAAGAVTANELSANAVTAGKIAAGTIVAADIAGLTITGDKVAANTLSANKLNIGSRNSTLTGIIFEHNSPSTNQVSWSAGTVKYINDAGVASTVSITGSNATWTTGVLYIYWVQGATTLSTTTTQSTAMSSNNVIFATYEGGVLLDTDFGRTVIDGSTIKTGTVTASQIAANTITATQILAGTITGTQLSAGAVTAGKIAAGTIVAGDIAAGTITGTQLSAGAVTAGKIAAGAIVANDIAALTITGTQLSAGAVTAGKIAVGAIVAEDIAAGTITGTQIAAGAIVAGKIAAGAIAAGDIAANAITASKLTLTNTSNLWPDFDMSDLAMYASSTGHVINNALESVAEVGKYRLQVNPTGTTTSVEGKWIQIEPGAELALKGSFWFASSSGIGKLEAEFGSVDITGEVTPTRRVLIINRVNSNNQAAITVTATVGAEERRIRFVASRDTTGTGSMRTSGWSIFRRATASLIVDGAVTADKIFANAVTAAKIEAGAVGATQIAANAITASKVFLQDRENLFPDGSFDEGSNANWTIGGSAGGTFTVNTVSSVTGANTMALTKVNTTDAINVIGNPAIYTPVKPGETYWAETEAQAASGTSTSGFYYRIRWYDRNKVFLSMTDVVVNAALTSTMQVFTKQVTAPAGARFAGPMFDNWSSNTIVLSFLIDRYVLKRANAASLIVDGTIVGRHIAAESVTASKMVVADTTNGYPDFDMEDLGFWTTTGTLVKSGSGSSFMGKNQFELSGPATTTLTATSGWFPCVRDAQYRFGAAFAQMTADAGQVKVDVQFGTIASDGVVTLQRTVTLGTKTNDASNTPIYVDAAPLSGERRVRFVMTRNNVGSATMRFGALTMHLRANASLIVDGAIKAGKIDVDAVTAGTIAAGAVNAREIAAGAVTASKLLVADTTNIWPDYDMIDPSMYSSSTGHTVTFTGESVGTLGQNRLQVNSNNTTTSVEGAWVSIEANAELFLRGSFWFGSASGGPSGLLEAEFGSMDAAGVITPTRRVTIMTSTGTNATPQQVFATAGPTERRIRFVASRTTTGTGSLRTSAWFIMRRNKGEMIVDGSIQANHVSTNEIITNYANIKDGTITSAKITDLTAAKITAGTALSSTITVDGTTLGLVQSRSADPAARINAHTVNIDPGKITISGATTLQDWRQGGDLTKIAGGNISANTITANKLEIGSRNVTLVGIEFDSNTPSSNRVAWTAGTVAYTNDAGTKTTVAIAANTAGTLWSSGVLYIYWVKDAVAFSTTTSVTTAFGADRIVLATYEGGTKLDATFGRTVIDGSTIKTGTVTATQIAANTLTADRLTIAARGVSLRGIVFNYNDTSANRCSWTAGFIDWIDDTGTAISTAINSGVSATVSSGQRYIYWTKGTANFGNAPLLSTATGLNNIIIAVYEGGNQLTVHYGNTIIDGSGIKTGSVTAGMGLFSGSLQSTVFTPGSTGWQINPNGNAEFNGVVISRQLLLDSGSYNIPGTMTCANTDAYTKHATIHWIETNTVSTAWSGNGKTYMATVSTGGSVNADSGKVSGSPSTIMWGWEALPIAMTRWSGNQRIWIRIENWTRNVQNISAGFTLNWKLYEVT